MLCCAFLFVCSYNWLLVLTMLREQNLSFWDIHETLCTLSQCSKMPLQMEWSCNLMKQAGVNHLIKLVACLNIKASYGICT